MNLHNVVSVCCPKCGCDVIVSESIRPSVDRREVLIHTNGTRWEDRRFLCGGGVQWDPNFMKELTSGRCTRDPELIAQRNRRASEKKTLIEFCADKQLSDRFIKIIEDISID